MKTPGSGHSWAPAFCVSQECCRHVVRTRHGPFPVARSGLVLLVVLLFCLVARAAPGPQDDSIRGRLKACLLLRDMQCVVTQYMVLKDLGRMPDWLVAFQNAFAVANRRAGECEKVARAIHLGLVKFAQKPVFIRFTVEGHRRLYGAGRSSLA